MKHIDINYHFIRNVVANGKVFVKKITIAKNSIGRITKPILFRKLELYWSSIGICKE